MKRTLERTTFMFVGALIASIAYFIGNANHGANAQDGVTQFDVIECRKLRVLDSVNESGYILLGLDNNNNPTLTLANTRAKEGGMLMLETSHDFAAIQLTTQDRILTTQDRTKIKSKHGGIIITTLSNSSAITVEGKVHLPEQRR